ncbi:MAG: DUF4328 domain-containing protein [Ilumatobacteraceae bacterium]
MSDLPPPPPPELTGGFPQPTPTPGPEAPKLQRIRGISKVLQVLMGVIIPLQLLGVFDSWRVAGSARDFLDGTITQEAFDTASGRSLGALGGLLVMPAAVLTIVWMYRMAQNLRLLGRTGATWAPGWALGGWFAPPVVLYVVPWLMFGELWRGSNPDVPAHTPDWKRGPLPWFLHAWWVLYGLLPIASIVNTIDTLRRATSEGELDSLTLAEQLDKYATLNLALAVISVGAAATYLMLVRHLSVRHMAATREP